MAAALKGLISICIVVIILVSSWLIAVLINYYGGQGKELKFRKTAEEDSFPGEKLENIFWFMQVRASIVKCNRSSSVLYAALKLKFVDNATLYSSFSCFNLN